MLLLPVVMIDIDIWLELSVFASPIDGSAKVLHIYQKVMKFILFWIPILIIYIFFTESRIVVALPLIIILILHIFFYLIISLGFYT